MNSEHVQLTNYLMFNICHQLSVQGVAIQIIELWCSHTASQCSNSKRHFILSAYRVVSLFIRLIYAWQKMHGVHFDDNKQLYSPRQVDTQVAIYIYILIIILWLQLVTQLTCLKSGFVCCCATSLAVLQPSLTICPILQNQKSA